LQNNRVKSHDAGTDVRSLAHTSRRPQIGSVASVGQSQL
jgi:hypothetical protein